MYNGGRINISTLCSQGNANGSYCAIVGGDPTYIITNFVHIIHVEGSIIVFHIHGYYHEKDIICTLCIVTNVICFW